MSTARIDVEHVGAIAEVGVEALTIRRAIVNEGLTTRQDRPSSRDPHNVPADLTRLALDLKMGELFTSTPYQSMHARPDARPLQPVQPLRSEPRLYARQLPLPLARPWHP